MIVSSLLCDPPQSLCNVTAIRKILSVLMTRGSCRMLQQLLFPCLWGSWPSEQTIVCALTVSNPPDPQGSAVLQRTRWTPMKAQKDDETTENIFLFLYSPVFLLCVYNDTCQIIAAGGQPVSETWLWHHLLVHSRYNIMQGHHSRLHQYMTFCFCIPVKNNLITSSACILLEASLTVLFWPFWPTVLQLHRDWLSLWGSTDRWVRVSFQETTFI